ncbi:hypothetical protein EAX61_11390 [Dokdonia sinensis]|uniref:OmpA-like domain-containing protein n=1 Tax=Dokdonia sinensis TaxID=2479847 RepID=A0A3M0FXE7_9FLAO|nr:OmpA family protein [Dokdonia sinensis]RMB57344.1 hypothetical protein EAX61_11390 [Dokdonia sinensis]
MKGFLSALFVFIIWAGASIYYLSLGEERSVHIATATNPLPIEEENETPRETPLSQETLTANSDKNLESLIETNIDDAQKTPQRDIDTNEAEIQRSPQIVDAQILADEIKRTIAISDTIDINRDEPEQSLDNAIVITKGPTVSTETFYPKYDNTDLILDNRLVSYATDLKALLEKNPEKKVTIIGHTDNVGNGVDNFQIALRKARQVKWYLTSRRGIPRKKITAISRGEEEPIESNDSKWGRSKNNRIEVIID